MIRRVGNFRRLVVPNLGTERRHEHERAFDAGADAGMVEADTWDEVIHKASILQIMGSQLRPIVWVDVQTQLLEERTHRTSLLKFELRRA